MAISAFTSSTSKRPASITPVAWLLRVGAGWRFASQWYVRFGWMIVDTDFEAFHGEERLDRRLDSPGCQALRPLRSAARGREHLRVGRRIHLAGQLSTDPTWQRAPDEWIVAVEPAAQRVRSFDSLRSLRTA